MMSIVQHFYQTSLEMKVRLYYCLITLDNVLWKCRTIFKTVAYWYWPL